MKILLSSTIFALVLALFLGEPAVADVPEGKDKKNPIVSTKQCIQVSRIKDIDILDNQTIVFYMLNHKAWVNRLPYPCPQLYHEGGIEYQVTVDKLCSVDIISVLHYSTRCGLGVFEPYDDAFKKKSDEKETENL